MAKQTKITSSARGKECTVRIPGVCNFDPETTVHAHKNGSGMGQKSIDFMGARCCSACHDVIDGRVRSSRFNFNEILLMFHDGIFRTQKELIEEGLVKFQ